LKDSEGKAGFVDLKAEDGNHLLPISVIGHKDLDHAFIATFGLKVCSDPPKPSPEVLLAATQAAGGQPPSLVQHRNSLMSKACW
jgi:hypothetical protein